MVAGFITALQSAVLAIENELGTAAARNYVLKNGAVTITGLKTFQDGAEFGTGNKAGTGLVRLPNLGAVKWRKADNSGDLGMALNASNHVAMDAVIDFAAGQTFGAFSYPDATTTSQGHRPDRPGRRAGGRGGGASRWPTTGVVPGTYTKITVDAEGARHGWRIAGGWRPPGPHPCGHRYRLRFAAVHDPERRRGGRNPPRVEPDRGREHDADGRGRLRQRPRERHRRGGWRRSQPQPPVRDASGHRGGRAVLGDLIAANGTPAWARLAGKRRPPGSSCARPGPARCPRCRRGTRSLAGDLPAHTHAESDVTGLVTDLAGWASTRHNSATGRRAGTADVRTAAASRQHAVVLRDGSAAARTFALRSRPTTRGRTCDSHLQSLESGAYQTVGGPTRTWLKYSEDFSVGDLGQERRHLHGDRELRRSRRMATDRRHDHGGGAATP